MQSMNSQCQIIFLDGKSLTLKQLDVLAAGKAKIDLTEQAWRTVARSREAITNMMSDPTAVVYGITTGFGSFANVSISKEDRKLLQLNLIRSHSIGVGKPVPLQIVRRMTVLRINTLSKGRSGIQTQNMKKFIKAFNNQFFSYIPQQGTVGASGDLAPLSHLALGLLGEGLAWDQQLGIYASAASVLEKKGLERLHLQEKQGLALINGTQFITSFLSDALSRMKSLYQSSIALYAFAVQIFGVDRQLFSKDSYDFYQQINPSLAQIILQINNLIGQQQSQLHKNRASEQQINSLLDFPEALVGIKKIIKFCEQTTEREMNSPTDNPLVYFKGEENFTKDTLISAGNFHGQYVAKAADFLSVAIFQLAKYSQARIQRYINGKISRLPPFLIKNGGLNSGFMISQYTTAALLSQSKILVKPASIDSIVTSAGQQDHVSMGGFASRKARQLIENAAYISSIELLLVLNAKDYLSLSSSPALETIMGKVKEKIAPLTVDRYYAPDVEIAKQFLFQNLRAI